MHRNFIKTFSFGFCMVFTLNHSWATDIQSVEISLGSNHPTDYFVYDVSGDGNAELFVTHHDGTVSCFDIQSSRRLWEKHVSSQPVAGGVVGNLLNTGAPILGVTGADGIVRYLWPGSGDIIKELPAAPGTSLRPSLAYAGPDRGDYLVSCGDDGQLRIFSGSKLEQTVSSVGLTGSVNSTLGRFSIPATSGDLTGDGLDEIAAAYESGVLQVIQLKSPDNRSFFRLPQGTTVRPQMGLGHVGNNASAALIFATDSVVQAVRWQNDGADLVSVATGNPLGVPTGHVLLGQVLPEPSLEIVTSSESSVKGFYIGQAPTGEPAILDLTAQSFSTVRPPLTPSSVYVSGNGTIGAVTADDTGRVFIWNPADDVDKARTYEAVPPTRYPLLCGDFAGTGKLVVVSYNSAKRELVISQFDNESARPDSGTWALGGNFYRNGQIDSNQLERASRLREGANAAFEAAAVQYTAAKSSGDKAAAKDAAAIMAGIKPDHPDAVAAYGRRGGSGKTLISVMAAAVLASFAIAAILWMKSRGTKK